MSTLCKSRMVEGQSGKTGYLTAKISVLPVNPIDSVV